MIHSPQEIKGGLKISSDLVVVGSGAGGATVAKELSQEGRKVVVLEAGRHFTRDDFNLQMDEALMEMYWYGGVLSTMGTPMVVLPLGRTVGGTTTVNSGTCFRMPHRILKRWHLDFGLWDITADELDLYYSAVEEYLMVQKADTEVAGRNNLLFLEGAKELGLSGGVIPRNAKDCEGYGVCCFGCPSGAKQSADVSYIPDAVKTGCHVYTSCIAQEVIIEKGRAAGIRGRFVNPGSDTPGPAVEVRAEVVVIASGAIHTPRILLAQGICNSSGMVGRNLTIHPGSAALALLDERLDNPKGIPQSTYVDEFADDGVMLEGYASPPLGVAAALPCYGKKNAVLMREMPYIGSYGGIVAEHSSAGRVTLHPRDKERPFIFYSLKGEDKKRFKLLNEVLAEVWLSLGAKAVYTQSTSFPELRNSRDLRRFREARVGPGDYMGITAYHPLGTCRMGSDPEDSVVMHTGETWDLENLFICDGSIVPTSLGVNPQLTIFALAMRCAGFIDDRLEKAAGRVVKK